MGREVYPNAKDLLICADCGGSNGYRIRLWKIELQRFASETGLKITTCHFRPGTSKWNKIEHRLFSHISMNWRGRPLISHEVIVKLIGETTTRTGLEVKAQLDKRKYTKFLIKNLFQVNEVTSVKTHCLEKRQQIRRIPSDRSIDILDSPFLVKTEYLLG